MFRLYSLGIGYLLGMIQTAFILGKAFGKIDIREHGSGNAGMTNVARVMGAKMAVLVLVCDMLKAALAYFLCSLIFDGGGGFFNFGGAELNVLPGIYGALGAILGHVFPAYLKFKGGKGIAAGLGFILIFDWRIALLCYSVALVIVPLTKYISLASIIGLILLPILIFLFGYNLEAVAVGSALAVLLIYKHKNNIKRLIKGEENKFSLKRKSA